MEVRKRYVVLIGVLRIRIIPASGLSLLLCWLRVTIRVMWLMTGSCNLRCIFRRKRDFTPTHALGNALPCMDTVGVVFGEFIPVGYSFDNGSIRAQDSHWASGKIARRVHAHMVAFALRYSDFFSRLT